MAGRRTEDEEIERREAEEEKREVTDSVVRVGGREKETEAKVALAESE